MHLASAKVNQERTNPKRRLRVAFRWPPIGSVATRQTENRLATHPADHLRTRPGTISSRCPSASTKPVRINPTARGLKTASDQETDQRTAPARAGSDLQARQSCPDGLDRPSCVPWRKPRCYTSAAGIWVKENPEQIINPGTETGYASSVTNEWLAGVVAVAPPGHTPHLYANTHAVSLGSDKPKPLGVQQLAHHCTCYRDALQLIRIDFSPIRINCSCPASSPSTAPPVM